MCVFYRSIFFERNLKKKTAVMLREHVIKMKEEHTETIQSIRDEHRKKF